MGRDHNRVLNVKVGRDHNRIGIERQMRSWAEASAVPYGLVDSSLVLPQTLYEPRKIIYFVCSPCKIGIMLVFGCPDRMEGLMHSSMLHELALKRGRSGHVSNLENVFHGYFGGPGCMPVVIPLSGLKWRCIFLWNKRIRGKRQNSAS